MQCIKWIAPSGLHPVDCIYWTAFAHSSRNFKSFRSALNKKSFGGLRGAQRYGGLLGGGGNGG